MNVWQKQLRSGLFLFSFKNHQEGRKTRQDNEYIKLVSEWEVCDGGMLDFSATSTGAFPASLYPLCSICWENFGPR